MVKVVHKDLQVERALKMIKKKKYTQKERDLLTNEIDILKIMDHPNIVKLYEFHETDTAFSIITEYCAGGELFDRILEVGNFTENLAAKVM